MILLTCFVVLCIPCVCWLDSKKVSSEVILYYVQRDPLSTTKRAILQINSS
jgi:hypothetical protein